MSRWGQRWAWLPEAGPAEPGSARAIAEAKELFDTSCGGTFLIGDIGSFGNGNLPAWLLGSHSAGVLTTDAGRPLDFQWFEEYV